MSLPILSDFAFGELSPIIQGQPQRPQFRQGGSSFVNFRPLRQGGFTRAIGTLFQGHTSSDATARVMPWVIDSDHVFVLELTNNLLRFWKWASGGLTLISGQDIATTYTSAELDVIQYAAHYPYFFLAHQSHPPAMITWSSGDTFAMKDIVFSGANLQTVTGTISSGTSVALTVGSLTPDTPGGSTYDDYVGWAVTGSGIVVGTTISAVTDSTHFTLSAVATNASGVTIALSAPYESGQTPALPFQSSGNYPRVVSVAFQRVYFGNTVNEPLTFWASISGIFDENANMQMALYETTEYQSSQMQVDSAGNPTAQPPVYTTTWTKQDDVFDADGVKLTLASDRDDSIRWITPSLDLFIGSRSALWTVPASATANTFEARIVQRTGSGPVPGRMVEGGCIFTGPYGLRVGQMGWQGTYNPWIPPDDLTFLAQHIFEKNPIVMWDFQQNPETILWFLATDGTLVCLLMDTAHSVRAWWHRTTNGTITSVAVIPGDTHDVVVLAVTRNSSKNLIEIIDDENWYDTTATNNGQVDANYLDSAVVKTNATPFSTVGGLGHLEGMEVQIIGDGAYQGTATVASGTVSLATAATKAIVGLGFTADFASMPIDLSDGVSATIGQEKIIEQVYARLYNTLDIEVGPTSADMQSASLGGVDVTSANPALFTGDETIPFKGDFATRAFVRVRSTKPLPCTVLSLEPGVGIANVQ